MLCIVQIVNGAVDGWIIATDTHDARRKAMAAGHTELAQTLYRIEFPPRGRMELPGGYTMLVD